MKSIIGATLFGLICVFSTATNAAVVTWTFSGTINFNGNAASGLGAVPGINVNDTITGTAIYNTNASPTDLVWGATLYDLTMPTDILIVEVNGLTFSSMAGGNLDAVVHNDGDFDGNYGDRVTVINQTNDTLVHVNIKDEVAPYDLISDQSLPTYLDFTKADEMDGWDGNHGSIQIGFTEGNIQLASFSIDSFSTSVVPIPAAVWLFGSGLIGLVGVARHKKA